MEVYRELSIRIKTNCGFSTLPDLPGIYTNAHQGQKHSYKRKFLSFLFPDSLLLCKLLFILPQHRTSNLYCCSGRMDLHTERTAASVPFPVSAPGPFCSGYLKDVIHYRKVFYLFFISFVAFFKHTLSLLAVRLWNLPFTLPPIMIYQ